MHKLIHEELWRKLIYYTLFYKQQFYKQYQGGIGKKLSNILAWTFDTNVSKSKCVCFNDIKWLNIMKMKIIMKNGSQK